MQWADPGSTTSVGDADAQGGDIRKLGVFEGGVGVTGPRLPHGVASNTRGRGTSDVIWGVHAMSSSITSWTCDGMSSRLFPA